MRDASIPFPSPHSDVVGPFVVMGVSGCGKSTVASLLAGVCGGVFLDADDFHTPENKAKMAAGIPLTSGERKEWLILLNGELRSQIIRGALVFLACSALKESYRNMISLALPNLRFIYLRGSKECIRLRLESRKGHFMPATLLDSQFVALEEPAHAIIEEVSSSPAQIVASVLEKLKLPRVEADSRKGHRP